MGLLRFVQRTAPRVYSGSVRRLGERLGIDRYLKRAYDKLESRITPDSHHIEVTGASAIFQTQRIQEYRRATEFVEPEGIEDFVAELRPTDVVWDVGANIGLYTCIAADFVSSGQVIAFEPHSGNVRSLKKNIIANGLNNVDVREVALSNKNTTTELRITGMAGGLGLHSLTADTDGETITVKTRKGDSLVTNGEAVPSVIKIDVEGAEGNVLEGLSDVLSHPACRVVYCEIHASESLPNSVQDFDHTPETVENKLQEAGFVLELVSDGDAYMLKGTRTTQPLDCIDL